MYSCIFPNGDDGWHCDLDHSCLQRTNYQLMDQDGIVNPILYGTPPGPKYSQHFFRHTKSSRVNFKTRKIYTGPFCI